MENTFYKDFKTYEGAYNLYSEIISGNDADRKNATIVLAPITVTTYRVYWQSTKS